MMPPNGFLVDAIMKEQDVRALYLPPSVVEQWTLEPAAYKHAANLDFNTERIMTFEFDIQEIHVLKL